MKFETLPEDIKTIIAGQAYGCTPSDLSPIQLSELNALQKYPPPGFNIPLANILLTSGRKEECLAYITKFVEG